MDRLLNVTTGLSASCWSWSHQRAPRAHSRRVFGELAAGGGVMLLLSRARPALDFVTRHAGIPDTPLTLFLTAGSIFLIMFYRFSVIISTLRDDNIALAQRVAILEFHIQTLVKSS